MDQDLSRRSPLDHRGYFFSNEAAGEIISLLIPVTSSHRSIRKAVKVNSAILRVNAHRGHEVEHVQPLSRRHRDEAMAGVKEIGSSNCPQVSSLKSCVRHYLNPSAYN